MKSAPSTCQIFIIFLHSLIFVACFGQANSHLGAWNLLVPNGGISAMHMILMPGNNVVIFDRTDFGPSNISLPNGKCRDDPKEMALHVDCWAHSILFDIGSNSVRPLTILTDTWCSSGGLDASGKLVQTGGFNDGSLAVRYFQDCSKCDWQEFPATLAARRWYASNLLLPENRFIVVGGRRQFNYEFVPKMKNAQSIYELPFLADTTDQVENNLYPFLHLSSDGNIFIFANSDSILLDYKSNTVVRKFPTMPGGQAHNYPSSGSSVMLPLVAENNYQEVEIMVCGGAPPSSNIEANSGNFLVASRYCGRITITHPHPVWKMEEMPFPRVMGDMLLLPTGQVLIINGAKKGTAGWGVASDPAFWPVLYNPESHSYEVLSSTDTPRLYHSTAVLLPDGRILVGGGNPHITYNFTDPVYPTELSLEAFSPPYLDPAYEHVRPQIIALSQTTVTYGSTLELHFVVQSGVDKAHIEATLLNPAFTTHSYAMNQRMLKLEISDMKALATAFKLYIIVPSTAVIAPPGFYLLFVVQRGIPSRGTWIKVRT